MARPFEDRYLSAATLHEAAAVLEGLAGLLDRAEGVFAEDAAADADHLRDLATTLAGWWPRPPGTESASPLVRQAWDDLLTVYVAHGLRVARGDGPTREGQPTMSTSEIEQKTTLSRGEVAKWLSGLAAAIGQGGPVEVALAGPGMMLDLPDQVRCELEIEQGDHEIELEIELSWPRPVA